MLRLGWRLALLLIVADAVYLYAIWPDWPQYRSGPLLRSNFIEGYEAGRRQHPGRPRLSWQPVPLAKIPPQVVRAVLVAEDARFYQHRGIDLEALKQALEINLSQQRLAYGGSTISQQTAKNLFLSAARNPLRKWHELLLTLALEHNLEKRRILEYYLNVAEFGRGVYGVEAAARHYWDVPVAYLGKREAIELAATLPSPVKHNPHTRTAAFQRRVRRISGHY